ncbi:MAG: S1 RNA-binding domain-containing protein, partial [Planctomycetales bacterium]
RKKVMEELEPGQTRDGVVRTIKDFGAFVDLGGVDGLLPVSQLSWTRVEHPKDVLSPGQAVKVKVQKVDRDSGRISLSLRDLLTNPWDQMGEKYPVRSVFTGKVTKTLQFGALVELEPGVEGMIHISELDHSRVVRVTDVVNAGDELEVQVLSVDLDKRRIGLSRKATLAAPAPKGGKPKEEEPDEPPKKRKPLGPLEGGLGRNDSAGDAFGLKW